MANTSKSPAEVHRIINGLLAQICGLRDAESDVVQILEAAGFALLNTVKLEFIVKSRGGTDDAGIKWIPLSRAYLAYGRRFAPGEQAALKRAAGLGRAHRLAPGTNKGLLTAQQLKIWKGIFASTLGRLVAGGMDFGAAKAKAAQIAWGILKSKYGARTKLDVYGTRVVEMLRDTGVLFNSLSYTLHRGAIEIGTKVEYASRQFAMRPAWPKDGNIPASWTEPVYDILWNGLTMCIERRLSA